MMLQQKAGKPFNVDQKKWANKHIKKANVKKLKSQKLVLIWKQAQLKSLANKRPHNAVQYSASPKPKVAP